jgi:uncharacterized membrane protein affecting hemolysin expression
MWNGARCMHDGLDGFDLNWSDTSTLAHALIYDREQRKLREAQENVAVRLRFPIAQTC